MDYPVGDLGKSLLDAARRGDEPEVRDLLTKGASFTTDWLGASPLHFAAQYGHLDTALLLMRAGMSWDAKTKVSKTPLHIATQFGHEELVKAFIAQGANIDATDLLHMTPLHWAAQKNFPGIVEILLQNGADMELENKFDKTIVDICMENGYVEILEKAKRHKECRTKTINDTENVYLEGKSVENYSDNEQSSEIPVPSPCNLLTSLSNLAGISQDNMPTATVTMDELALLQATPINFSTIPLESIRSIVLTDAGRLALQLLNKGLDNTILQPSPGRVEADDCDDVDDNRTIKIVSYKDSVAQLDQNPEQYLTTSHQIVTSNHKNPKTNGNKNAIPASDLLPSTSSGIALQPVFPECNLRSNGDSSDNFDLDLDSVLLQRHFDNSKHPIDLSESLTVRAAANGLPLSLTESVCKKL